MLEIKKITKIYDTDGFKQKALDEVSVNFRECEFAAILGPSGSGKTTFLNIIGGLDHYTSGDLVINEISTKRYKDSDWDSYRNHRIGFVFQSYNLITHQSILNNVSLALTLSGISKKEGIIRAKKALRDVGLENHMHKRPNQLSGGQMQRVAIARALVNDPDILLADEPTGALDSVTSVQIMELLKKIAKKKLVIMVTHNPDLAKEYANRIINLKDGMITSDTNPYDGGVDTSENRVEKEKKTKKTKMSFSTALMLSFNNLMTKKGRTILVSFAGSIGIIGIALILALSTGFQNYIDKIQEDTLTSYPLTIMQESTDITGALLSMSAKRQEEITDEKVHEQQYMTTMFKSISTNDLRGFKKYLEDNYNKVKQDLSNVKYSYSVKPLIYTRSNDNKLYKLNPSDTFESMMGATAMSTLSNYSSVYSEMVDNIDAIKDSYDLLKGRWPDKYDELLLVLNDKGVISDFLVYSLGLRDPNELKEMVNKMMLGESVNIENNPMTFTYDDLLNIELKMITATDLYKYNSKYDLYEDMSEDNNYMNSLYDNALKLKIVGVICVKEGVTSMALNPGVNYRSELVKYIINNARDTEIVNKQISDSERDIISGNPFGKNDNGINIDFKDLVDVDQNKLQSAFNINIDSKKIENETMNSMKEISSSITTDITEAENDFKSSIGILIDRLCVENAIIETQNIDQVLSNYLNNNSTIKEIETKYGIPEDTLKMVYTGLLKGFLNAYITAYNAIDSSLTTDSSNPLAKYSSDIISGVKSNYLNNIIVTSTINQMAHGLTEAKMNKDILSKVGELTGNLSKSFANAFNVDSSKIADSFKLKMSEEQITRIISSMITKETSSVKSNLAKMGYQDFNEPTFISLYFTDFDGKEDFLAFLDGYNNDLEKKGLKDKIINYTDTTGILMGSVKTIVGAVSYALIGFVSISLVVSSIMIGIITYISVFERTKEIGILRAIGASKGNISSIFNAETFIIGLLSGLFGIGISYLLIPVINKVIHHFTGNIPLNALLYVKNAGLLIILSIVLTLIGGLIPAKSASKKDPVEALRSE